MSSKTQRFKVYEDPGHAWIAVKVSLLEKLGIADKITHCSYMNGGTAYLECDCDWTTFATAAHEAGITVHSYVKKSAPNRSHVRSYPSYSHA